ncbi:MAG TPA: CRTAC1 family protein, partial [Rhodothermales bacterium]|nr:CRTAC1 family protein [Rhodothermales bacterium]
MERYGFHLQEVSEAAGIDFTHQAPKLDPALDPIMPQIAVVGAAVSVVDYDRDGWQDLYVTSSRDGSPNAFYRNLGDGTFEDVAPQVGIADVNDSETGVSMGAVWGDYDNDGYEDLFLYKWGCAELYHNDAGRHFTRVTDRTGFPKWANVNAATWLDYDRDGVLDLFFASYYPENTNLWQLSNTRIMPESFEYARNGGRKYLFRGKGDGTFEDKSSLLGPQSHRWTFSVGAADLRGTGYPDLFVANDYGINEVFFNEGGERFREATEETGVGAAPKSGMNVSFGDVLNRGQMDVYVSNISQEGILIQGNNLWVPRPGGDGQGFEYQNMAGSMGVELGGWSWGAQFGDLNNDGALDLFVTNGYISADRQESYWYDYSKVVGANKQIIIDAKNWPAMEGRSLSGYQQKRLWLGDGMGQFQEVSQAVGVTETHDGRAVVLADLWNRGVLDVVMAHQNGPLLLYKNDVVPENQWITFDLEGTASNRSAIGARVELFWDGKQQIQQVLGGSGFAAQNDRRLHFGLGEDPEIEKAVIHWPSGKVQTIAHPEPGEIHHIKEAA